MPRRVLRTALAALGIAHCVVLAQSAARAQDPPGTTADPLVAARALFASALQDEQAGRPAAALEKFESVRSVRDTASVEYRIGSCHEALGHALAAYGAYQAAAALGKTGDAGSQEVASAASARVDALASHLARLTLVSPAVVSAGTEVRLDGTALALSSLGSPMLVDPGRHTVTATAENAAPFQAEIALGEGGQMSLMITLGIPPSRPPLASGASSLEDSQRGATASQIAGRIAVAGGATLLLGSTILLLVRSADIAKLDDACPRGQCPAGSNVGDLESTRSRALVEGPLALGCGIAGVAAAAIGVYLVLAPRRSTSGAGASAYFATLAGTGAPGVGISGEFQ